MSKNKLYLLILDGFALGEPVPGNAVFQAKTPFMDQLFSENQVAELKTHGACVGLPEFQTGGSEMGHLTIGAGRPVKHMLTIINDEIEDGTFFEKSELRHLFEKAKTKNKIHFVGMASDGGIHSFLPHLFGLQKMAKAHDIKDINIHALLDGRDVPVRTAKDFLEQIDDQNIGDIASVGGRFYGMDRDLNWERTQAEYRVLCDPETEVSASGWQKYLDDFYKNTDDSDYYVPPVLLKKEGQIQKDDIVICFNFRTDRMRQPMAALCDDDFSHFDRPFRLDPDQVGVFGNYYESAHTIYSLSHEKIKNTLCEVVSKSGGTQLRIAESEKKNHVTFFLSGEQKDPFENEERIIIPSPKCPIYSDMPEMSAAELTKVAIESMNKRDYTLIIHNYANGDLVGHSADLPATIIAVETLERELKKLIPEIQKHGYDIIITADHGNCEIMKNADGTANPSHTKSLVPFVLIPADGSKPELREKGTLEDVAPTILKRLGLEVPGEMTGRSLEN